MLLGVIQSLHGIEHLHSFQPHSHVVFGFVLSLAQLLFLLQTEWQLSCLDPLKSQHTMASRPSLVSIEYGHQIILGMDTYRVSTRPTSLYPQVKICDLSAANIRSTAKLRRNKTSCNKRLHAERQIGNGGNTWRKLSA